MVISEEERKTPSLKIKFSVTLSKFVWAFELFTKSNFLKCIHRKIVHRDLKGANIFLTKDGVIKIGDFGISRVIDQTVQASKSFVGTPYYLSPEMVEGKPYSKKADIWALGVILYHLCALKLPFEANSLPLLALKIVKGSFPPLTTGHYSPEIKSLILSMLQVNPKKRPSI